MVDVEIQDRVLISPPRCQNSKDISFSNSAVQDTILTSEQLVSAEKPPFPSGLPQLVWIGLNWVWFQLVLVWIGFNWSAQLGSIRRHICSSAADQKLWLPPTYIHRIFKHKYKFKYKYCFPIHKYKYLWITAINEKQLQAHFSLVNTLKFLKHSVKMELCVYKAFKNILGHFCWSDRDLSISMEFKLNEARARI